MSESCQHPRPDDALGLPCAFPGCPEGTPKERVAVMHGSAGVLRIATGRRYEIEADQGVVLWERKRASTGDAWEWTPVEGRPS